MEHHPKGNHEKVILQENLQAKGQNQRLSLHCPMTLHMHSDVMEGQAQIVPLYRKPSQAKWCYRETGPTNNHSCIIIYLCNVLNIFPVLV